MKLNRYLIRRLIWMVLLTGSFAVAGGAPEYLGFTLNLLSLDDAKATLKARRAIYDEHYGYRGNAKDLPVIKVNSDPLMAKHGRLEVAWLMFTPKPHRLYKISITWADAGETYQTLRDILEQKYVSKGSFRRPKFITEHQFRDNEVRITLKRNAFGFGDRQRTTLEYVYLPALPEVETMKKKIDHHIRKRKLEDSGDDL